LGEVPGGAGVTGALEACQKSIIGHDPFQLNAIKAAVTQTVTDPKHLTRVFSAIEVACFDLMGKATGRPVVDLLGGKARDSVDFSAYLFYKYEGAGGELGFDTDPDATGWAAARQAEALDAVGVVAQAKAMCKAYGFKSIKLKGGALPPEEEVEAMFALRDAFGPDTPLRLDPNAIWSYETALKWGKELLGVLEYYEDPVRGQADMARLRQALDIPLATNMCTTSFDHIPKAISLGSEDVILSDHHAWGGLQATVHMARICQTFGRGVSMHSNSHLGISLAAMVHVAAALPNLDYACDTHYPWQSEEVLTRGRFEFENGSLAVPEGPGLGIELDRDALVALHESYLTVGISERDDELAMQAKQPGWAFQAQRW